MGLLNNTQQEYYREGNYGDYQFTSLDNIIAQFQIAYVGEDKIISKVKKSDVAFHAQRALQELSFDTLKSIKSQELTIPTTLQIPLPQDYVNYTKISWVDGAGIKHPLYPTSRTSNPFNPFQNDDGGFDIIALGDLTQNSDTVVLDAQYDNIIVGMNVSGVGIETGTTVIGTSLSSSITTVTLSNDINLTGYVPFGGGNTMSDATIKFHGPADGTLTNTPNSTIAQEGGTFVGATKFIKFGSTMENSDIKIGMLVSNRYFPLGTTVVDIDGVYIHVSEESTATATASETVVFTSKESDSEAWSSYQAHTSTSTTDDYEDDRYWPLDGERYGLNPQHAQVNGSFYIDQRLGKIHFSSNINGKTIILDYISDSLGTDEEMQVHKFAEEAIYKHIAYAILSTRANTPEFIVARFKKERFAETRKAKLRLSNLKLEELTQVLRGKSKQIKH